MLQAAKEGSDRAAQGQQALDKREAQVTQRESDMQDLKHSLHTQHLDLQHKHQQLQVFSLLSTVPPWLHEGLPFSIPHMADHKAVLTFAVL